MPFIAGTGMSASASGDFGEPAAAHLTRDLVPLAGARSALVRPDWDSIARVSLPDGKRLWRKSVESFDFAVASPDGKTIALVDSGKLVLLAVDDGAARAIDVHARHAAFSEDGRLLATCGDEGDGRVLDVASGRTLQTLAVGASRLEHIAFSPNGQRLVAMDGARVRVWDRVKERTVYLASFERATSVAWETDRLVTVATSEGTLLRADVDAAPRPAAATRLTRLPGEVVRLTRVPRSTLLVADLDRTFSSVVDLATGKEIARLQKPRYGRIVLTADAAAAVATGGRPAVYELPSMSPRVGVAGHLGAVTALASRQGRVASGGDDGAIIVWDEATHRPAARRVGLDPIVSVDVAPAASPGELSGAIALGTDRGDILVYDRALERRLLTYSLGEPGEYTAVAVAFAPDGKQLVAAGGQRAVLVDLARKSIVAAYRRSFREARFTAELLVVGPGPVQVVRRRDGALLRRGGEGGSIDGFALGIVDGRFVVSAESGEYRNRISLLGAKPYEDRSDDATFGLGDRLAFSPDGKILANVVGELELLATSTAATMRTLPLHTEPGSESYDDVEAVAFAGDGKSVLLGYESGFSQARSIAVRGPIAGEIAPGVKRDALPVLADLSTCSSAVGPRDVTARTISEPSRTIDLPGRAQAMTFDGRTILLSKGPYDWHLYDVASEALTSLSVEAGRVEVGPAGSFLLKRGYGEPATIVGRGEPLAVKEACRDPLSVAPGAYLCSTYREMTLEGSRTARTKLERGASVLRAMADDQGNRIALATPEQVVLRSAVTLEQVGTVAIPSADWLAFSADGRRLAVVSNAVAVVFDAATTKVLRTLEGHDSRQARLSADGRRLATIGNEDVRVWDVETGAVVGRADTGPVGDAVGLSPDGRTLLVADRWELAEWPVP